MKFATLSMASPSMSSGKDALDNRGFMAKIG